MRIAWETNLPCGGLAFSLLSVETFDRFLILEMIKERQIFVGYFQKFLFGLGMNRLDSEQKLFSLTIRSSRSSLKLKGNLDIFLRKIYRYVTHYKKKQNKNTWLGTTERFSRLAMNKHYCFCFLLSKINNSFYFYYRDIAIERRTWFLATHSSQIRENKISFYWDFNTEVPFGFFFVLFPPISFGGDTI